MKKQSDMHITLNAADNLKPEDVDVIVSGRSSSNTTRLPKGQNAKLL